MFEKNVEKFILEDALKLSLQDYISYTLQVKKVKKGLRGKTGQCIKNSINFDKNRIAIGFCVFDGNDMINTINIIIHAVNYNKKGKLIDNTKLKDYTFYEIDSFDNYTDMTEEFLREKMCQHIDYYKEKAIDNFTNVYASIKSGNFRFREEEE